MKTKPRASSARKAATAVPNQPVPSRAGRVRVRTDSSARVRVSGNAGARPPIEYDDRDLCAYAYHVWIQLGMPCGSTAWDEAKACLDSNLPLRTEPRGTSARRQARVQL